MSQLVVIERMRIQNANAMSSPFTIGIPAVTSWLGFGHALERKLRADESFQSVRIHRVGLVVHHLDMQTYREKGGFRTSIKLTANTAYLREQTKPSKRPPFVPEARAHLNVSIVLEIEGGSFGRDSWLSKFHNALEHNLQATIRFAGGDILDWKAIEAPRVDDAQSFRRLRGKLMPGYVVCDRQRLLRAQMEAKPQQDALDALFDALALHHQPVTTEETSELEASEKAGDRDKKVAWESKRLHSGWIVPLAIGFQGITPLGSASNTRDSTTPHRFAESVVSLGECVMPFRLDSLDELLWEYHYDELNSLYLCRQRTTAE